MRRPSPPSADRLCVGPDQTMVCGDRDNQRHQRRALREHEKNHDNGHLIETALGGYAAVNGGRVFFAAFDLLRLNDVFVGQFNERCLRLCIAQRGSVRPAFGGSIS